MGPPFIQPPPQQRALPQQAGQLALPQPSQQLALNQPPQQLALPQPSQQLALPQPPQQPASAQPHQQLSLPPPQALALEYNPRGEKRKNIEIREIDRKRIILENDMKRLQRKNDKFIQEGKGLRGLYQKMCVCKDEKFQKIVLGLSDGRYSVFVNVFIHIWRDLRLK